MAAKGTAKGVGSRGAMGNRDKRQPVDLGRALIEAFLTNERINQVLIDLLNPEVWRAQLPCAKRRNIATTCAHTHNVRCMRLKMSAPDEEPPAKLDRAQVTVAEAKEALSQSARAMVCLIERSLARGGHVPDCRPKVHRHVALQALADLKQPGLKPLIKAAFAAWKDRTKADV